MLISFIFACLNSFLITFSFLRKIQELCNKKTRSLSLENIFLWPFLLLWQIGSLSYLFFCEKALSLSSDYFLVSLTTFSDKSLIFLFLPIFILVVILAFILIDRHFLNFKVLLSQTMGSFIIILGVLSFFNSTSLENAILRFFLIIISIIISFILVRSVLNEIAKRKKIQKTTQKILLANQTLKKLDRAKSDFISSASHQLQSPLSVIKGISSMLLDGSYGKLSSSINGAVEKMHISNERLIGLIGDLLNISHLEEGRVDFVFEQKDLNQIAQNALSELTLQAKNQNLYLKFKPWKKTKILVWADGQKLTEIVSNLIDNAIKYTRRGGITVEIKKIKNFAQIRVQDTGIGLKEKENRDLFQKFVRAGRGKKMSTTGTGLGLYVVLKMTQAHKGKVWAESPGEGQGSTFVVELPTNLKQPPDQKFVKSIISKKPSL